MPPRMADAREAQSGTQRGHRPRFHQSASLESKHPIRGRGRLLAVGRKQDKAALLRGKLAQEGNDPDRGLRVQVPRRLVRENDRGLVNERARDCNALLLASGEAIREALPAFDEPHSPEHFADARFRVPVKAVELERQAQVFLDAQAGDQIEELEHETDPGTAHQGALPLRAGSDVAPFQPYRARIRLVDATDEVQQSGLAAAAPAGHRHEFTGGELRARSPQHFAAYAAFIVGLAEVLYSEHRGIRRGAWRSGTTFGW